MLLQGLKAKNFRNLQDIEISPAEKLNFVIGENGQGKTSILEAISFLSNLRSFKNSKPNDVLNHYENRGTIQGQCSSSGLQVELCVQFERSESDHSSVKRLALVNGKPIKSSSKYLALRFGTTRLGFHAVTFNPTDHDLVHSDPAIRRSFLDSGLVALQEANIDTLSKFKKTLDQRNALLKRIANGEATGSEANVLDLFNEQFCKYSADLLLTRLRYLKDLAAQLPKGLQRIAPTQKETRIFYRSEWGFLASENEEKQNNFNNLNKVLFPGHQGLPSLDLIERAFWLCLNKVRERERRTGFSLFGPQRDDWGFCLGPALLAAYGSQGEVRSSLLALKIAEVETFRASTGHRPVFLLDDFSSELDSGRRKSLLGFLTETDLQVFVTTTEPIPCDAKTFWIKDGRLAGV